MQQHEDGFESFLEEADREGRVLLSEFDNGYLLNVYFPAGVEWKLKECVMGREDNEERNSFRKQFYSTINRIVKCLQDTGKVVIVVGDFNTLCGLYDSAYMKYDVESKGFVEGIRSMSEWLESLLLPKS